MTEKYYRHAIAPPLEFSWYSFCVPEYHTAIRPPTKGVSAHVQDGSEMALGASGLIHGLQQLFLGAILRGPAAPAFQD